MDHRPRPLSPDQALKAAAGLLRPAAFAAFLLVPSPSFAQNPSMSDDFARVMEWLSLEMAHGLAFNAGSTFDPPREMTSVRLQPDVSLGVGSMPLAKTKFPQPKTKALQDAGLTKIFPDKVLFPNLTMHLRAGLPWRSDVAFRFTDMTTPPNYQISPGVVGKGQSNSIGFALRKHFYGGGLPTLSVGAAFNHVFGRFQLFTKFNVDEVEGFSADSNVNATIQWNVNSLGVNAVLSRVYGNWTPFGGVGLNYATGSVRARLEVLANTPLIAPVIGEASRHPETVSSRVIFGTQYDRSWMQLFVNTEVKASGAHHGESWIMHAGLLLPFRIGGAPRAAAAQRPSSAAASSAGPAPRRAKAAAPYIPGPQEADESSSLIFLQ